MSLPAPMVDESWQSAEFYANKVLREMKGVDDKQVEWVKMLKASPSLLSWHPTLAPAHTNTIFLYFTAHQRQTTRDARRLASEEMWVFYFGRALATHLCPQYFCTRPEKRLRACIMEHESVCKAGSCVRRGKDGFRHISRPHTINSLSKQTRIIDQGAQTQGSHPAFCV